MAHLPRAVEVLVEQRERLVPGAAPQADGLLYSEGPIHEYFHRHFHRARQSSANLVPRTAPKDAESWDESKSPRCISQLASRL